MQVAVVKDQIPVMSGATHRMLAIELSERIIDKCKITLFTAQLPDNLTGPAVDFKHRAQMTARNQNMTVLIDFNGIHMRKIEAGPGRIFQHHIRQVFLAVEMQHQISLTVEFLQMRKMNSGIRFPSAHDGTHIHFTAIRRYQ